MNGKGEVQRELIQIEGDEALELIRKMPCSVCFRAPPSDPHHWVTRGAGGSDSVDNLVSLCRPHHQECHTGGKKTFFKKYGVKMNFFRKARGLKAIEV